MVSNMISVIVPVYNIERYVERCINSIVNQSYTGFEIIIVDDGSTDDSGSICDRLSETDSRIQVIHQENKGLSAARNRGMREARGEYICFVDGDDAVSASFLDLLYGNLIRGYSDIASCARIDVYEDTFPADLAEHEYEVTTLSREKAFECLIKNQVFYLTVWGKVYKREVIGDILFKEGKLHEDEFFTWRVLQNCDQVSVVSAPLYYYNHREGSIMETFSRRRLDAIEARYERHLFVVKNYPHLVLESKQSIELPCVFFVQKLLRYGNKTLFKECLPAVKEYYNNCRLTAAERKHLSVRSRITYSIADISLVLCALLRNLVGKGA